LGLSSIVSEETGYESVEKGIVEDELKLLVLILARKLLQIDWHIVAAHSVPFTSSK
jgi:hypothetical protein